VSIQVRRVFDEMLDADVERYARYWEGIKPLDNAGRFRRWLFAFCSVHTTWEGNLKGYSAIQDFAHWLGDRDELRSRLVISRAGLHNNRADTIHAFSYEYWSNPTWYARFDGEPWWAFRDRVETRTKGLGLAKTSFAIEMCWPTEAGVACLDVHMLRLYGSAKSGHDKVKYNRFEEDWIGRCWAMGAPPYVARMVYWDKLQGKQDSRYWSHVLEKP